MLNVCSFSHQIVHSLSSDSAYPTIDHGCPRPLQRLPKIRAFHLGLSILTTVSGSSSILMRQCQVRDPYSPRCSHRFLRQGVQEKLAWHVRMASKIEGLEISKIHNRWCCLWLCKPSHRGYAIAICTHVMETGKKSCCQMQGEQKLRVDSEQSWPLSSCLATLSIRSIPTCCSELYRTFLS